VSKYVGLHVHSQFSFLDGEASLDAIVSRIKSLGQTGGALTDHQEVSGHVAYYKKMTAEGLNPILGIEGYFHPQAHRAKELGLKAPDYSHITVLARNNTGLRNLWAWSSIAYTKYHHYRAIVDWSDMKDLSEGLWASDGCGLAFMAKAIVAGDDQLQHELMGRYLDTFGDYFFMELHTFQFLNPQTEDQKRINAEITLMNQRKVDLAEAYGVPLVVVNDAHYAPPEDWERHNLVWSMSTKQNADNTGQGQTAAWIMDEPDLFKYMRMHGISDRITQQAIDNTAMIAATCDVEIKPADRMPAVNATEEDDIKQFLALIEQGFKRRVIDKGLDQELYRARIERECKVIVDNHFPGYFNAVYDLVRHAKEEMKIVVGPGRGSAGGALCSYLMGITELDPIKYDLLFERFLAEGRGGLPDIDIDIPQARLAEIKEYTAQKYGHEHVCGIGTFTRSAPKSLINDLCRAMSVPINESKLISKAIGNLPTNAAHTPQQRWNTMLELRGDRLRPWIDKYPAVFAQGQKMVGMIRQSSVHASGWIISPDPLLGELPLRSKDGKVVSQFEQGDVEWMGFVKFDLLGIRHLDTIQYTLDFIKERHGVDINVYDFGDDEFCDPAIWDRIGKGDCLGLFQLEADLMASTAKKHKPQSEREVAELLAVNRPGVIDAGLLQPYIDRKHGREMVTYDHPMLEEITGETYGILIYQEQIMKMSRLIAGFSPADADWLRKVVGKKKVNELPALKEKFVEGARANCEFTGTCTAYSPEATIQKLWTSIEASGEYLFNKSHSVAYALIGTWEAWLRHYYYPEFIAACLLSDDDADKIPRYVRHAERNGVEVLPPDINASNRGFTLTDQGVRYGLTTVKQVGDRSYDEIVRTRPFESLADMVEKVSKGAVNKAVTLNLIHVGAFDSINPDRAAVEREFYDLRKIKERDQKPIPDYSNRLEMFRMERDLIGSPILYDPLKPYHQMISDLCLRSPDAIDDLRTGDLAKVGGLITKLKPHRTKKGDWMAFMTITFEGQDYEVLVFPEAWASSKMLLEMDAPVIARVIKLKDDAVHMSQVQRLDWLGSGR
jgi:DNA polymerase III subunit alpha